MIETDRRLAKEQRRICHGALCPDESSFYLQIPSSSRRPTGCAICDDRSKAHALDLSQDDDMPPSSESDVETKFLWFSKENFVRQGRKQAALPSVPQRLAHGPQAQAQGARSALSSPPSASPWKPQAANAATHVN